MSSDAVLIIGGGPAGMAAAIALANVGVRSEIVELSTDWRPGGIGISFQSAPLRASKTLGLFAGLRSIGRPHERIILMGADGTPFGEIPQVNLGDPGDPPFLGMTRQSLHEVMVAEVERHGIPVRLGVTVARLGAATDDGIEVELTDGSTKTWAWVVGADGVNSAVRQLILPDAPTPEFAGQSIWRAEAQCPPGIETFTMMVAGPLRLGLVPLLDGGLYIWLLDSAIGSERPPREKMLEMFRERLAVFGGPVEGLEAQFTDVAQVDIRALHWLILSPPWHADRVLLIGDAAHTTTPHLAYGAGLALEDAVVLGELAAAGLEFSDLAARFEERRHERARLVVETSLQLSRWEQQPGPPNPDAGRLTGATMAALSAPI